MKNKRLKKNFAILFIIVSVLTVYKESKKYPDIETSKSIKKIVDVGDREIYSESVVSDFNSTVKAFKGTAKINIDEDKRLIFTYSESDVLKYVRNEADKTTDDNKFYQETAEKYKYYNGERLELYLILYNHYNDKNLSIDEIKDFVDNKNLESEKEIKEYIDWYYIGNAEYYYEHYIDRFNRITDSDKLYNEYNSRYGNTMFYDLPLEEQKKVFNEFNELNIIKDYIDRILDVSSYTY